jgi:hypothetical protein
MRDPERIERMLQALREAWEANPDQRLGQLVYNACRTVGLTSPCPELFNCEDDAMLDGLRDLRDMPFIGNPEEPPKPFDIDRLIEGPWEPPDSDPARRGPGPIA